MRIVDMGPGDLRAAAQSAFDAGGRMQMVYAWRPRPDAIELRYVLTESSGAPFSAWRCPAENAPSLATVWPLLSWYEREITDLYGVAFEGQPEPYPLVLHDGIDPIGGAPPVKRNTHVNTRALPEISSNGTDVQLLPFGPVRADVLESAEFFFFYTGEAIIHYQPQLFFKHRGMERRFEGLPAAAGVILAERVSGVGSVAHSLAYCQAVETAARCEVPARAQQLRVLLAEMERLYNHLHYLGHLSHTTTLKVAEAEGKLLEEKVKRLNARITGSRFLRGIVTVGGLRRDLPIDVPWLRDELESLRERYARYRRHLESTDSHLDRLITTGHLDRRVAFEQGATGPVDRASGMDRDLRRDHPYAAYGGLPIKVALREAGDAHAREQVRMQEIEDSVALVQRILLLLEGGPIRSPWNVNPGAEGLGWAESPRGTVLYAAHFGADQKLARVKIKSPSFSNWRAFPFTVQDSNMMDYAINEASFGLTMAGCDR
jgi:Ni,Fe-hydrogenase III large subunit